MAAEDVITDTEHKAGAYMANSIDDIKAAAEALSLLRHEITAHDVSGTSNEATQELKKTHRDLLAKVMKKLDERLG